MKKILIILTLLAIVILNGNSQSYNIRTVNSVGDKYLLASLPKNSIHNHHKLKIKILGGNYYNHTLATRTYSISSRNQSDGNNLIVVNQEQSGGGTSHYKLKVYETLSEYDFVLESTKPYLSIIVDVWLSQDSDKSIVPIKSPNIIKYDFTTQKDITNKIQFNLLSFTDMHGNIGIGTDTPQARLDVRGKIVADEVQIKVNKGADFVFDSDYRLKPLSEVKAFVKINKHLPEIPSEKQMKEEGININELQIKLLQKIEELTLYVIELKEENEILKDRVRSLEIQK